MRILFVQFAGDFKAAHDRLAASGTETYFGHRYVLEQLGGLAQTHGPTAILCCKSPSAYDVVLPSGLRVIGAGATGRWDSPETMRIVRAYRPTHLVVLGPLTRLIRWGLGAQARVLCIFADSFEIHPIRRLIRFGRLPALLNDPRIDWVGNHGLGACQSLARIGVAPDKILPWDWLHVREPRQRAPKASAGEAPHTLFYAGLVTERKGIRDVIAAAAHLKHGGVPVRVKVAGAGEIDQFRAVAEAAGVGDAFEFLGLIPNDAVTAGMREADIVVVPSQHAYPEGLPLTIYEALCANTPIVASDHPMFVRRLADRESALIYPAGRPAELAGRIRELLGNPALYAALSGASQRTWEGLQIPLKWGDLVARWLADGAEDRRWLGAHSLAART